MKIFLIFLQNRYIYYKDKFYRRGECFMKKTRKLFIFVGKPNDVTSVLEEILFKGVINVPLGTTVTSPMVEECFANNRSLACALSDYHGNPIEAYAIRVNPEVYVLPSIYTSKDIGTQFAEIADALDCDIGDHKSNSSGLNGVPTVKDCAYCKYLSGIIGKNGRTVYKDKYFFVLPTEGQFIKGYFLIIPYRHIMSNAELTPEELEDFKNVLEDVELMIKLTYHCSSVLVWENGSGKSGIGKAKDSIVHSHVHIAPSTVTSNSVITLSGFPFKTITLNELSKYNESSYLLIRTTNPNEWIIDSSKERYIPRQYIRQILAEEYGIEGEKWNWRKFPFYDNVYESVDDVVNMLKQNWEKLPERVKDRTRFLISS